ncbi:hypothetical protein NDU88_002597 [Pleurodeles waltl]|uniref:Uncharacterized protein n=1 Tax=Pleurodeles waltl TaxID=8319 RepID=A0AAV7NFV6_PLEWA|nr:hypothetical protein NDU88_002597 [Pleurodeles waltl]
MGTRNSPQLRFPVPGKTLGLKKAADRQKRKNHDEEKTGGSERRTDTGESTKEQTTRHQEPNSPGEQDRQTKEPSHDPGGSWLTKSFCTIESPSKYQAFFCFLVGTSLEPYHVTRET